jgi:hypothetical protein
MALQAVYSPQLKQFVRQNPGLIRKFANAYKAGSEVYCEGGAVISKFRTGIETGPDGVQHKNGQVHHQLWTVEAGGKKFVIKEILRTENNVWERMTGERQYRTMNSLSGFAKLLSKVWKHDMEILTPQLGASYWDTSFIVTEFVSHPRLIDSKPPYALLRQHWIFEHLARFFMGVVDIGNNNAFYDTQRGKIIINDPLKERHIFPIRAVIYAGMAARYAYRKLFSPEKTWHGANAHKKDADF